MEESKKELIRKNIHLFKCLTQLNSIANTIYEKVHGGAEMNFYDCFIKFESGIVGWIKEANCFLAAVEIYDNMTCNESFDLIAELEDVTGIDPADYSYEEIIEIENFLLEID